MHSCPDDIADDRPAAARRGDGRPYPRLDQRSAKVRGQADRGSEPGDPGRAGAQPVEREPDAAASVRLGRPRLGAFMRPMLALEAPRRWARHSMRRARQRGC
jgi:hypothetical protein